MANRHEILTVEQMYATDRAAVGAGADSYRLMRSAGAAVAREVTERWNRWPVAILCGPGLNGGDGYVAARLLQSSRWTVRVLALGEPDPDSDAGRALRDWGGMPLPLSAGFGRAQLVIDALFGAGLSRPIPDEARALLQQAEAAGMPILSVDLPSGLPGDDDEPLGYAPRAEATVTFHRKKPAHVLQPAAGVCGDIVVADIGIPEPAWQETTLWENHPDLWLHAFPWPAGDAHKHSRGRLGVIGGGRFETGAARLAVRAGQRIAGAVRLYCDPAAADIYAAALEAAMLKPVRSVEELGDLAKAMDAVVIGPAAGVNDATRQRVEALAAAGPALCLDADALTVFQDDPEALFALVGERDVMTPHPGEFERIFPGLLKASRTRIEAVREAARRAGCVVLLKGPDTTLAHPDGRCVVNAHATAWLATAGSGDVLAGIIGGLLAGGMPAFEGACCGVWMHGDAGRRAGAGLTAEDLPGLLPVVLVSLAA